MQSYQLSVLILKTFFVQDGKSKNPFANFSEILNNAKEAQARAGLEASNVQEELSRLENLILVEL